MFLRAFCSPRCFFFVPGPFVLESVTMHTCHSLLHRTHSPLVPTDSLMSRRVPCADFSQLHDLPSHVIVAHLLKSPLDSEIEMTVSSNLLVLLRPHYPCRVTSLAGKTIKVVMLNLVTIVTFPSPSRCKHTKGSQKSASSARQTKLVCDRESG